GDWPLSPSGNDSAGGAGATGSERHGRGDAASPPGVLSRPGARGAPRALGLSPGAGSLVRRARPGSGQRPGSLALRRRNRRRGLLPLARRGAPGVLQQSWLPGRGAGTPRRGPGAIGKSWSNAAGLGAPRRRGPGAVSRESRGGGPLRDREPGALSTAGRLAGTGAHAGGPWLDLRLVGGRRPGPAPFGRSAGALPRFVRWARPGHPALPARAAGDL